MASGESTWSEDSVLAFSHVSPVMLYVSSFLLTGALMLLFSLLRRARGFSRSKGDEQLVLRRASSIRGNVQAYPAYGDGHQVDVYLSRSGKWVAAACHASLITNPNDASEHEVLYTATLESPELVGNDAQHVGVAVDLLRDPFLPDEVVEIFSATKGTWLPGRIAQTRRVTNGQVTYLAAYQSSKNNPPLEIPASQIRRLYQPGAPVQVYLDLTQGWVSAKVTAGAQWPLQDSASAAKRYWKKVPIEIMDQEPGPQKAATSFARVPSYLLRPAVFPRQTTPLQAFADLERAAAPAQADPQIDIFSAPRQESKGSSASARSKTPSNASAPYVQWSETPEGQRFNNLGGASPRTPQWKQSTQNGGDEWSNTIEV